MHPGEKVLLRIIGQGRWQHPFHEHGNHVRVLARDGNLILSASDPQRVSPAAALHHHHHTGPGDGRNLLLDRQGLELGCLRPQPGIERSSREVILHSGRERLQHGAESPTRRLNYFEWCQDHNKPFRRLHSAMWQRRPGDTA